MDFSEARGFKGMGVERGSAELRRLTLSKFLLTFLTPFELKRKLVVFMFGSDPISVFSSTSTFTALSKTSYPE